MSAAGADQDQAEIQAELLALAVAGRQERLTELALGAIVSSSPGTDLRAEFRGTLEALASLAFGSPAEDPGPQLRARVLASFTAKRPVTPRRALLIVDMLVDYLTPGRALEVPRARDIVPSIASRLESAREEGIPVVYVVDQHERDDADLDVWGAHAIKGTEGDEVWPALAPKLGDIVVHKPTYSAFSRSNLEEVLARLKVDTLVLTGCLTEIGLFCTAKDALERGFAVEIPPDAQAGSGVVAEQVALGVLRLLPPYAPARRELLARITA